MEMIIIGLLVIAVAVWYGFFKPVETIAHAIDDEVQVFAAERKAENISRLSSIQLDDDTVTKATANLARLNSIKL